MPPSVQCSLDLCAFESNYKLRVSRSCLMKVIMVATCIVLRRASVLQVDSSRSSVNLETDSIDLCRLLDTLCCAAIC